ncbi:hypothetical protein LV779_35675 [Streptomyces thinghirensis]|nr:hypothetical protein [Streptomyces thinghirensis]
MWSNVPPRRGPLRPRRRRPLPRGLVPQGVSAELIAAVVAHPGADGHPRRRLHHKRRSRGLGQRPLRRRGRALDGVSRDECVRPASSVEVLAGLKSAYHDPAFAERFPQIEWNVTAGNASPVNDGASAVLITSSETAARLGLRPLARLHSFAATGSDPLLMLTGVVPATEKVLRRASSPSATSTCSRSTRPSPAWCWPGSRRPAPTSTG